LKGDETWTTFLLAVGLITSLNVSALTLSVFDASTANVPLKKVYIKNPEENAPVYGFLTLLGRITVILVPF
jgi:hypothetical protein